jgi:tRNA pseudouridine38-40 synthase
VQNALEQTLDLIDADATRIAAAGRTDSGVHATGQVISFHSSRERSTNAWLKGMNSHLPDGVRVQWVRPVLADFNARFSATGRRYLYVFFEGEPAPLHLRRVTPTAALDDAAMHRAAQCLVGEHDFTSFRAAGCQSPTPFRRVDHILVRRFGPLVVIDVAANAFLLRMVRNLAGALWRVGRGEWPDVAIQKLLEAKDRDRLGRTAAAAGLYLVEVRYPADLLADAGDRSVGFPRGDLPPVLISRGTLDRL